jgi:crossover junction endodeoxyribonuclease RuvC
MNILGIDPGTATTGFGIIQKGKNGQWRAVDFGVIKTDKNLSDSQRLLLLKQDLLHILKTYKPAAAGVEKIYFENNQKTAITVAQARGVILLTIAEFGIQAYEFTPLQVKNTLTGYGAADKKQIQFMVKQTFELRSTPKPDDAADALAIALCCQLQIKNLDGQKK